MHKVCQISADVTYPNVPSAKSESKGLTIDSTSRTEELQNCNAKEDAKKMGWICGHFTIDHK